MSVRRILTLGAALVAASVALAGCAPAPEGGDDGAPGSDVCARMVTNSGGLEDRSFNQSSWEGLQQAEEEYGIEAEALVSTGETDLEPNVQQAVDSGCELIVTVGYELAQATLDQAEANPDLAFSIVDEVVEADNVKPVVFDTAQASFLAGYLAAGVSKTGVVATFGGGNQPPVTLFMDGFVDGVAMYNEVHGTQVRALGWNKQTQDGAFTGDSVGPLGPAQCSSVRPATEATDVDWGREALVVRVTPRRQGTVRIAGALVRHTRDWQHAWQTGTERTGTELVVSAR